MSASQIGLTVLNKRSAMTLDSLKTKKSVKNYGKNIR